MTNKFDNIPIEEDTKIKYSTHKLQTFFFQMFLYLIYKLSDFLKISLIFSK